MIKSLLRFGSFSVGIFFTIFLLGGCVEEVGSVSPESAKATLTNSERIAKYESIKREVMADEHPAPSVSSERRKFKKKVKTILKAKRIRRSHRRTKTITERNYKTSQAVAQKKGGKAALTRKRKLPPIVKYY